MFLEILGWIGSLIFVVVFIGLCIFVHELGHFLAAKWRGLHIDAFSLGFRKIWSKKINGIEYRIGCLPFGGYVELPQVDTTEAIPKAADGTELPPAKPLDRIITAVAGPLFNVIFGLFLACFVWIFGMPMPPDAAKLTEFNVLDVVEDSPEYRAGLRPGDTIVAFDNEPFEMSWAEFTQAIMLKPGLAVELDVRRPGVDGIIDVDYTASCAPNQKKPAKLEFEGMPYPFFTVALPIEFHPDKDSAARRAGMGDTEFIYSVDGKPHSSLDEFLANVIAAGENPVTIGVLRDGEIVQLPPFAFKRSEPAFLLGVIMDGDRIAGIAPDSPAAAAGLQEDDRIISVNGRPTGDAVQLRAVLADAQGAPVTVKFIRGTTPAELVITPMRVTSPDLEGSITRTGYPNPFQQLKDTVSLSINSLRGMLLYLGNKMAITETTSAVKPRNMSGIVGMATILFSASNSSFMTGLYFVVVVCFALAIFNILPLPVLDGGHTLFALLELIFRRPVPRIITKALTYLFIGLLVIFMIYVTFYDVKRIVNDFQTEEDGR